MAADPTQHQSTDQQRQAQRLSMRPTSPPGQIEGYTIQSFLGSGAFGEVWSGIDRRTGRQVAIKYYTHRSGSDVSLLAREVEKLAALAADRYVVQLLDVGWNADPPYYVMDYIVSGSLEELLAQEPRFSVEKAVDLFKECAYGLMHLHGKGILHCDLKPGNILLDQDHKPRLADFGQSRLSHEETPALGTLFYMAPEQADMRAVPDARWDVYALGALLYRMLCGSPPYRDPKILSQLESASGIEERLASYRHQLGQSAKPNLHRRVKGVDRGLADIIDRCIAYDPKERFPSIQSVLVALRDRDQSQARRPLMIVGLLGPLALLIGLTGFGWNFYRRAISQTDRTVMSKAIESNTWAAQLAARSAGEQIENHFRAVEELAADPELILAIRHLIADSRLTDLRLKIANPADNDRADLNPIRAEFLSHPLSKDLFKLLQQKVKSSIYPNAASWFVCDRWGNQIAAIFNELPPSPTMGRNYSYRSYFNDQSKDSIDPDKPGIFNVDTDPERRAHIQQSHLSGVFKSKATATWKVAFSTPIFVDGEFEGLVAITTEMGNFIEFENARQQYVMMVDSRPGQFQGVILEHPKLHGDLQVPPNRNGLPGEFRVDLEQLRDHPWQFVDPLQVDDRQPGAVQTWVAGVSPVNRTLRARDKAESNRDSTGLIVIAVQDHESVMQPVRNLARQLSTLALWAVIFVGVVFAILSYWILRTFRQSKQRLAYAVTPASEISQADFDDETIQARPRPSI